MDTDSLINEYLLNKREERGQRTIQDRTFYCSELGYCPRKIYYKRMMPKDVPVDTLKVFMLGDMIHEKMTEILGFKYKNISSEGRLCVYIPDKNIRLSGKYDDLIITEDNKLLLIEKKSIKNLYYVKQAHPHHILQAVIYMKALGVDDAIIVYIEKNTWKTLSFPVKFNKKDFLNVLDKAAGIQLCLDNHTLPPKQPIGSWECNYCDWKQECNKEFNPDPTPPKKKKVKKNGQ